MPAELVEVNGVRCILYRDVYEDRDKNGKYPYLYYLRHSDDDWDEPITIERHVLVNRYGAILAQSLMLCNDEACRSVYSFKILEEG